jgi:anti-sigma factor RsiW
MTGIQVTVMSFFLRPWMATCHETGERLSDYVDGELEGRTRLRVRRHLARCERCQALLASLNRALEELRSLGSSQTEPVSDATVSAVLARIERESR